MAIIVVAGQKGGGGKTTLAAHLVYRLRELNHRVLAVDTDKQGSLSLSFPSTASGVFMAASALFEEASDKLGLPEPIDGKLSIIRADVGLLSVDKAGEEVFARPRQILRRLMKSFDYCVIDTPPLVGTRLFGALGAGDGVVTPLNIGLYELSGLGELLDTIQIVHASGLNPGLRHLGIQIMKNNTRSREDGKAIEMLREQYGEAVLPDLLAQKQTVMQAVAQLVPVWSLANANVVRASKDGVKNQTIADTWRHAMDEIIRRIKK